MTDETSAHICEDNLETSFGHRGHLLHDGVSGAVRDGGARYLPVEDARRVM